MACDLKPMRDSVPSTGPPDTYLIYIPGPSAATKSRWKEFTESWQNTARNPIDLWLANKCHSYVYDYDIPLKTISTWHPLLEEGTRLLSKLREFIAQQRNLVDNEKSNIVFICHSLGGVVLKQAFNIAHDSEGLYGTLLKLVTGVVFIACPHGTESTDDQVLLPKKVAQILHSAGVECNTAALSKTTDILLGVAQHFKNACPGFDFPILSIYEEIVSSSLPRQLSFPRRRRTQDQACIGRKLAQVGCTSKEHLVGIENDHWHIGRLEDHQRKECTEATKHLKIFIDQVRTPPQAPSIMRIPSKASLNSRSTTLFTDHGISTDANITIRVQRTFTVQSLVENFALPRLEADLPCYLFDGTHQDRHFYGRAEILEHMDDVLLPRGVHTTTRLLALHGSPGLGKSEVAAQFVLTRRDKFDAIFWVHADDKAKMQRDFALIAVALGLERSQDKTLDPEDCRRIAKAWLKSPNARSNHSRGSVCGQAEWLIVFDGLTDVSVLSEYAELFAHGAVLVTSRDPGCARNLSSTGVMIEVPPFSDEEGTAVLQMILERDQEGLPSSDQDDLAREVAIALGGWPLALRQMAGIMREQYLSLDELRDSYQDPEQRPSLQSHQVVGLRDYLPRTMAQVMTMAIECLSPEARCLVEICSMMDYDCIQEFLFEPTKDLPPFPCFPIWKSKEYRQARTQLIKLGLVTYNQASKIWTMHRIIQETIRVQIDPDSFGDKFRFAVTLVVAAWNADGPRQRHLVRSWSHFAKLFSHVQRLQDIYPEYKLNDESEPYMLFAWLLNEGAWWRHETGNTQVVDGMLQLAKSICKQLPEQDVLDLLSDIYHGLGGLANESNRGDDCLRYNESLVSLQNRSLAPGGLGTARTAMSYNQRGTGHMMKKKYKAAILDFERSRDIFNRLPLDQPCMDTMPVVNMSVAYWLTGKLEVANSLLTTGLEAREEAYGKDDSDSFRTGRYLHTLGNVRYSQAMLQAGEVQTKLLGESEEYHRRALAQYQSTIGTHHRTADVCHRVAEHCLRQGDCDSANRLIDEALNIWSADQAAFKPEIARTTFLKSRCADCIGDQEQATTLKDTACRLRSEVLATALEPAQSLQPSDFDDIVAFWSR